jgi:hypothetical protein
MKKSEIFRIINEEVEVILTNNEMIEFFDIDASALLDEMVRMSEKNGDEEEEGSLEPDPTDPEQLKRVGMGRVTTQQHRRHRRGQGKTARGGLSREVEPREVDLIQGVEKFLTQMAEDENLLKYRPRLQALLKQIQRSAKSDKNLEETQLDEKDLSAKERRALPDSDFALSGKGEGPKGKQAGSYPIPDESHGRSALSRVAKHGTSEEKAKVRAAVKKKFPGIEQGKD